MLFWKKSKYEKRLPYCYEAEVRYDTDYPEIEPTSYFIGDTICSIIRQLSELSIEPEAVTIYEVFQNKQTEVPKELYSVNSSWKGVPSLCKTTCRYGPLESHPDCIFNDRKTPPSGPFVK